LFEYYLEPNYPNIPTWHAVRSEDWKYIHYDEVEAADELYNLKADPHEMKNVIADPASAEQIAAMKSQLKQMLEQTK
jgi:N-acetylglucosamine-6-sulfatase